MKTDILIVTFKRDFIYLEWCLKSISKFASGFNSIIILIPNQDLSDLLGITTQFPELESLIRIRTGEEWIDKGMTWHMYQIICSDQLTDADFICHIDADCIFTAPVTPETFIKDGKPILQYERLESITKRHAGVGLWGEVTQRCLPFPVHFETMRQHGETYTRETYAETRRLMEVKTGVPVEEYIRSGQNAFPQQWCEFVTLGNVAIHCFWPKYHLVDNALKENPDKGDFPIGQFWSHGAIDQPQDIWWEGKMERIVPIDMIRKVLG